MHELITIVANYLIAVPIVAIIVVWLKLSIKQRKELIVFAITAGIASLLLAKLGDYLFYNSRPFVEGHFQPYFAHGADNGFPSGHTLAASFLALVVWQFSKKLGQLLLLLAILIGLARVIAGVHHVIDIVGALVFAGAGFYLANRMIRANHSKHHKPAK
jgi:undecaprenyl-diphosphatase